MKQATGNGRLLGQVKMAANNAAKMRTELERVVVRAYRGGCSAREIAKAGSFGSHHRVTEIVERYGAAEEPVEARAEDE